MWFTCRNPMVANASGLAIMLKGPDCELVYQNSKYACLRQVENMRYALTASSLATEIPSMKALVPLADVNVSVRPSSGLSDRGV